ncbi:MAG TPA: hypothetical protein VHE80_10925 [Acidimicrobiales bacterium]|nr:hypothetical protein [Acidimicrobiales bacterium]
MASGDSEGSKLAHPTRQQVSVALAAAVTAPGVVLRITDAHLADPLAAVLFGLSIVGAAFMLSWAAEAAQLDISAGLAIAVLALIAVLPEYAVDLVFAIKGGDSFQQFGRACPPLGTGDESPCALALANMTGANRLLIGIGWSMVVFVAWIQWRKRGDREQARQVTLDRSRSVELSYLAVATMYSLTLPLKRSITLVDAAILVSIFVAYTVRISRAPAEEPHLIGPAAWIGEFPKNRRRTSVIALFVVAAAVILLTAEHFADALVGTGKELGIREFLLIQWLAPLASEAPELLVAGLYAARLNTNAGLGTLVSSKVNQWTLLVGTLPIAFAIASRSVHGLPIVAEQRGEVFLTAAQSVFAVAILITLSMTMVEATVLFALFSVQFVAGALGPSAIHDEVRILTSVAYLVLAVGILLRERRSVPSLFRDGFRVKYAELTDSR